MELLILLLAVGFITIIGHGIWVFLAWMARAMMSMDQPAQQRQHEPCPQCDIPVSPTCLHCSSCGLDQSSSRARRLRDLEATRRILRSLVSAEELDRATEVRLGTLLARQRSRALGIAQPSEAPAPPAFVPIPPVPVVAAVEQIFDALPVSTPSSPVIDVTAADVVSEPPPLPVVQAPPPPLVTAAPPPPRRPLTAILSAFMEARNILWGELVGGLLIVGCSIALVLTLWGSLQQLPYFPFLLFSGITAALFGAGLYTLHHWKLTASSRGLLLIVALLAPLNLLVLADPSARGGLSGTGWIHLVVACVALLVFGRMIWSAGRDLIGAELLPGPVDRRWLLALAIVGTTGTQLLTPALFPAFDDVAPLGTLLLLAFVPAAVFLLTTTAVLAGLAPPWKPPAHELRAEQAHALFSFLGLALFALLAALAFLQSRDPRWLMTLPAVALPVALAGAPGLAAGLLVRARAPDGGLRTAGTGVTLAGLGLMLAGLAVAWPHPWPLLVVASVNAVTLGAAAYRGRASFLHIGSQPCLALAVLLAVQLLTTDVPATATNQWLLSRLASANSSLTLALLVAALTGWAIFLDRRKHEDHAHVHALVAVGLGAIALLLATAHGARYPGLAAAVHALLAVTALAACVHTPRHALAQVGAWLVLPATLWLLHAIQADHPLRWAAVVAGEGLLMLLAVHLFAERTHPVRIACQTVGGAAALLALGLAFVGDGVNWTQPLHAVVLAAVAAQAFLLAGQTRLAVFSFAGSTFALFALMPLTGQLPLALLPFPLTTALLTHAALGIAAALVVRPHDHDGTFADPLEFCSATTSTLAIPFVLLPGDLPLWRAGLASWQAGLWLVLAWRRRSPGWFALVQAGTSTSLLFTVYAFVETRDWFGTDDPLDLRFLQVFGIALALLSLVWVGQRRTEALAFLWPRHGISFDRAVTAGLIVAHLLLLTLIAWPAVAAEWNPGVLLDAIPWWNAEAFDWPARLCTAALAVLLLAELIRPANKGDEPFRIASVAGLCVLAGAAVVIWAGGFAEERATASALRWGLAGGFLAGSLIAWWRHGIARLAWDAGLALGPTPPSESPQHILATDRAVRPLLSIAGILAFLFAVTDAIIAFAGQARGGPDPASVFAQMGFTLNNLGPLALLAAGLWGSALRERSAGYAFLACHLLTLSALAGYALSLPAGVAIDFVLLALIGISTAAVGALAWLAVGKRIPVSELFRQQSWLGMVGCVGLGAFMVLRWANDPTWTFPLPARQLGLWHGWLALGLAFCAAFLHSRRHDPPRQVSSLALTLILVGVLAGCLATAPGANGWPGYRVLTLTWCALAAGVFVLGCIGRLARWPVPAGFSAEAVSTWVSVGGGLLCAAALRGRDSPYQPWVPAVASLAAALIFAAPALWYRWAVFSYPSGLSIVLAGWLVYPTLGGDTLTGFLLTLSLSLAMGAALWSLPKVRDRVPFSLLAAPLAVLALAFAVWATPLRFVADFPLLLGAITAAVVGLAFALERTTRIAMPGFYVLSFAITGLALLTSGEPVWHRPSVTGLALAVHLALLASLAWRFRDIAEREWGWFFITQTALTAVVATLAIAATISGTTPMDRFAGPLTLLLLVPGAWMLAEATPSLSLLRAPWLAPVALAGAVASLALLPQGEAFRDAPRFTQMLALERSAWLVLAVAGMAIVYLEWTSFSLVSLASAHDRLRAATRPVGRVLFALALILALVAIAEMMPLFDPVSRRTPLSMPAILAMFVALAGLLVTSIRMALLPRLDPLSLSEHGRQLYVYLAEVLFVLIFVNARLNVPEMFRGPLAQYWPVIVMLIAFAGVGLSELFYRRGLAILSVPLQRTAMLLPIIPLVAFWARPTEGVVDLARNHAPGMVPFLENLTKLPWHFEAHAMIWFLAGGLYLMLAFSRRSTGWALLAALSANFALWALWTANGLSFAAHPQVWLIPLGLIALVAEYIERERLSAELAAALRYLGICLIYVASTAELFIVGLGNSLWLPVILALLCVLGVLAGIWLRVKAFLFLGISFLLLDLGTMIWHAAVNREHTWVWWASGIVLGVAILALFALFEKRRNDVLRLLDDIKAWD